MYQACINLLPDVPRQEMRDGQMTDTQTTLLSFIKMLIGNLVVVPGHPDKGEWISDHPRSSERGGREEERGRELVFEFFFT
jgi:hypothetical protein